MSDNDVPTVEGYVTLDVPQTEKKCQTWYKVVGLRETHHHPPIVTLHGGPGVGHEYLLPLKELYTKYGHPVAFYDQLGCGKSTRLPEKMGDASFWTEDLFIKELSNLCQHLGLTESGFHLLGQSWGGMLACSFAGQRPPGLRKLIIESAPASMAVLKPQTEKLISQLPPDVQQVLRECEEKGEFDSERYEQACMVFYKRHVCRLEEWPEVLYAGFGNLKEDPTVYLTMNGPSEFAIIGTLKNWTGLGSIPQITAATLLINGRYDEVPDPAMQPFFDGLQKVKWITFENSSHTAHLEETDRFLEVVGSFLSGQA